MRRTEVVLVEVSYDDAEYPDVEHVFWGTTQAPGTSLRIIAPPATSSGR